MTPFQKIKAIRKELKLSQANMANRLGIKQSYYSEIERGEKEISNNVLTNLFKECNVSADWFSNNVGQMFNANSVKKHSNDRRIYSGGDTTTIKLVSDMIATLPENIKHKKIKEIILKNAKEADDTGLYFYLLSNDFLIKEHKQLFDLKQEVSEFIIDIDIISSINDQYLHNVINGDIEFSDYEDFKNKRLQKLHILIEYEKILKPIMVAAKKFVEAFKPFDVERKINFLDGDENADN